MSGLAPIDSPRRSHHRTSPGPKGTLQARCERQSYSSASPILLPIPPMSVHCWRLIGLRTFGSKVFVTVVPYDRISGSPALLALCSSPLCCSAVTFCSPMAPLSSFLLLLLCASTVTTVVHAQCAHTPPSSAASVTINDIVITFDQEYTVGRTPPLPPLFVYVLFCFNEFLGRSGVPALTCDLGHYATGDWWVVGPVQVISTSPEATSTTNGTILTKGRSSGRVGGRVYLQRGEKGPWPLRWQKTACRAREDDCSITDVFVGMEINPSADNANGFDSRLTSTLYCCFFSSSFCTQ